MFFSDINTNHVVRNLQDNMQDSTKQYPAKIPKSTTVQENSGQTRAMVDYTHHDQFPY